MTDTSHWSLPPLVEGSVYGHLTVTVDEVLWCCNKYPGEVIVLLQWWGDNDSVSLRPGDISKYPESAKDNHTVTYKIHTNLSLFQTYLKQFNKLKLLLINDDTKGIVGHVEVNNLCELASGIQYQKYFPIITTSGSRIGELRVDFDLIMDSIPDETSVKKVKKRSRRKNKMANNPFHLADPPVEDKSKQIKKGCKTCSDMPNPTLTETKLNLELPMRSGNQAPPNTERSDSGESVLLQVIEKGKKLRDAMVLSVLEDQPTDFDEKLLLKPLNSEKDNDTRYKPLHLQRNGEIITSCEEKLINDYLDGKAMKEEDEIVVLNTLHADKKELKPETRKVGDNQKVDGCCLLSKDSCSHSAYVHKSETVNDNTSNLTQASSCFVSEDECNALMKRVNCFRLTVDSLTITSAGWKKINQIADTKTKNVTVDGVPPPGATYFVECHFVEDSPRTQAQPWKTTPLRFCSRRQIEQVVYFGQSSAHALRPPHSAGNARHELSVANCLVCWRHLHQRVPALLGHFSLAGVLPTGCLETTVSVPVTTGEPPSSVTVAHLRLTLQLGRDKIYFGPALLDDTQNKVPSQLNKDHENIITGRFPLDVKGSIGSWKVVHTEVEKQSVKDVMNGGVTICSHDKNMTTYDVPVCSNCSKNIVTSSDSLNAPLCVSCYKLLSSHRRIITETDLNFTIPENIETKEVRHHEFIIGLDTVIGFPLFAAVKEELSCYLDYKFPQITSDLKGELNRHETTSRVVGVTVQPVLSSVHRHALPLPVALPLSPLLAACSPGLTLRLWQRYYKPTPRDHMVAMALLPMDELCLMELEFDEQQQQRRQRGPVTRVLELPLALVPSSVTAAYQHHSSLGALRLTVTYSNHIKEEASARSIHTLPSSDASRNRSMTMPISIPPNEPRAVDNIGKILPMSAPQSTRGEARPIEELLSQIAAQSVRMTEGERRTDKNRFWTGPFGKERHENHNEKLKKNEALQREANNSLIATLDPIRNIFTNGAESTQGSFHPVMKEDFDILAEGLEQKFNQLQSDLLKQRQRGLTEVDDVVSATKLVDPIKEEINDDFLSFHSLSSNSTMDRLPFILGPPADFRDIQNTVGFSNNKATISDTQSENSADTISGFLKEDKNVANLGSNESFEKEETKLEVVNPTTFKARIKVDRAVNLKAVKGASNGKKGKVPPTTWVSFGTGDCCERNCGSGGLVCSGQRFMTPVVRRNYNPVWNLAWDIDLPVDYLQQVNKRLVFRVFEENLDVAFGFASANLSILTSGLPCLSSWLSINDLAGACKGQIKIVVTPLEDVSKYQECTIFDNEEDEFEELKDDNPEQFPSPKSRCKESVSFVASEGEVFVQDGGESATSLDREVEQLMSSDSRDDDDQGEDPFSADDIISDYKNTLENNFRNEMAGLENLIKFLRVGSMSNELSFLRLNENKENVSSNPSSQHQNSEIRSAPPSDLGGKLLTDRSASDGNTEALISNMQKDKVLIDASTETVEKEKVPSSSSQTSSDNVLSKLLQQISMFQLPTVKITDSTSQTVIPETKESCTETNLEPLNTIGESRTVHMKDAFTETNDICDKRSAQLTNNSHNENPVSHPALVCSELGSALLQHFLTCRPAAVRVVDSATQTVSTDKPSTTNSSGLFTRSQPSGMSSEVFKDSLTGAVGLPEFPGEWITSEEAHSNTERLITIDNNIKDLERFLKENLVMVDREDLPSIDSKEGSSCGSLNSIMDTVQPIVKECSQSSSDLECLGTSEYSPELVVPRETPDGGNPSSLPDRQDQSSCDHTGTTLQRRGTYVIDKAPDHAADLDVD